jgi:hypothetical protein
MGAFVHIEQVNLRDIGGTGFKDFNRQIEAGWPWIPGDLDKTVVRHLLLSIYLSVDPGRPEAQ